MKHPTPIPPPVQMANHVEQPFCDLAGPATTPGISPLMAVSIALAATLGIAMLTQPFWDRKDPVIEQSYADLKTAKQGAQEWRRLYEHEHSRVIAYQVEIERIKKATR